MTHFLKFPDEKMGMAMLAEAGFIFPNGEVILSSHEHTLDIVGQIIRSGKWDEQGNVITPPEVRDGWHVNFMGALPEAWKPFLVSPKNPVRVFYI